jgi:hypothetical protein
MQSIKSMCLALVTGVLATGVVLFPESSASAAGLQAAPLGSPPNLAHSAPPARTRGANLPACPADLDAVFARGS